MTSRSAQQVSQSPPAPDTGTFADGAGYRQHDIQHIPDNPPAGTGNIGRLCCAWFWRLTLWFHAQIAGLHKLHCSTYLARMTMPVSDMPDLFDQSALLRNLARAAAKGNLPGFLDDVAATELIDRFETISRTFSHVAIISHDASRIADAIKPGLGDDAAITDSSHDSPGSRLFLDQPDLPAETYDCIFACPGLEWANDLPGSLTRLRRALKPDGVLLAAMLGGESLNELRASWLQAETAVTGGASPRVAPFCDVRDAGGLLQRAGFALPVVDTDRLNVRYDNALALMNDLKALGLSNALAERRRSLVTPHLMARVCAHYDQAFADPDNRVRATFQMIYLNGWSPHESQPKPLRPGSAKTRLADALRVDEGKLPRD